MRTEIAVTARNILPDVGSVDSKMNMNGDKAAERPKEDREKSLSKTLVSVCTFKSVVSSSGLLQILECFGIRSFVHDFTVRWDDKTLGRRAVCRPASALSSSR